MQTEICSEYEYVEKIGRGQGKRILRATWMNIPAKVALIYVPLNNNDDDMFRHVDLLLTSIKKQSTLFIFVWL